MLAAEALRVMTDRPRPITTLFVIDEDRGALLGCCTSTICCAQVLPSGP